MSRSVLAFVRVLLLLTGFSCAGEALAQPPMPIQVSPSAKITNPNPIYMWREAAGARKYYFRVA